MNNVTTSNVAAVEAGSSLFTVHSNALLLQGGQMTLTRTRANEFSTGGFISEDKDNDGNSQGTTETPGSGVEGSYETVTSESFPGYRNRIRNGDVIMGNFHRYVRRRSASRSSAYFSHPGWGSREVEGDWGAIVEGAVADPNTSPADSFAGVAGQSALIQAYARMNQASLCTIENVHSLGQTVSMLQRPFENSRALIAKMFAMRKKNLGKTVASALRATKHAWLEYRYGWKPLLMDAETIISIANKKRSRSTNRRLVARSQLSRTFDGSSDITGLAGPNGVRVQGTVYFKREVRVSAGVLYDLVDQTSSERLGKIAGTRARDLPSGLWEIVPYSFVVDWFVSVGDWLEAVTPNPAVTVRGNWVTTIQNSDAGCNDVKASLYVGVPPAGNHVCTVSGSNTTQFSMTRVVNQPLATFPLRNPNLVSLIHAVDGLALFGEGILSSLRKLRH